jgi:hypothetical protein
MVSGDPSVCAATRNGPRDKSNKNKGRQRMKKAVLRFIRFKVLNFFGNHCQEPVGSEYSGAGFDPLFFRSMTSKLLRAVASTMIM